MYPSIITTFPHPTSSSRLNNPSHSALENLQSSTIGQIETIIGLSGNASTLGTLIGDVRSPASNGGGHVQTAVVGGTGQTNFTKGDLLVATGPSVLSKLAVGVDGQILTADSSAAAGVSYKSKGLIAQNSSIQTLGINSVNEVSVMSATIPANTFSTNKAVRGTIFVQGFATNNPNASVLMSASYGGKYVASVVLTGTNSEQIDDPTSPKGNIVFTLLANGSSGQQRGTMFIEANRDKLTSGTAAASTLGFYAVPQGSVVVDSTVAQPFGVTIRNSTVSSISGIKINGFLVEGLT